MRTPPDANRQRAYLELLSKFPRLPPPRLTAPLDANHRRDFTRHHEGQDAERYYQAVYLQRKKLERHTDH